MRRCRQTRTRRGSGEGSAAGDPAEIVVVGGLRYVRPYAEFEDHYLGAAASSGRAATSAAGNDDGGPALERHEDGAHLLQSDAAPDTKHPSGAADGIGADASKLLLV